MYQTFVCLLGVNTTEAMAMAGQDNMVPLILNVTGDSNQHQPLTLSPTLSPPLTLSQVP